MAEDLAEVGDLGSSKRGCRDLGLGGRESDALPAVAGIQDGRSSEADTVQ